jgi:hypothetical protein
LDGVWRLPERQPHYRHYRPSCGHPSRPPASTTRLPRPPWTLPAATCDRLRRRRTEIADPRDEAVGVGVGALWGSPGISTSWTSEPPSASARESRNLRQTRRGPTRSHSGTSRTARLVRSRGRSSSQRCSARGGLRGVEDRALLDQGPDPVRRPGRYVRGDLRSHRLPDQRHIPHRAPPTS